MTQTRSVLSLTVRQAKAIPIILQARSIEAGCVQAGLSKARFYKWLKESKEFEKEYRRQRDVLIEEAMESLKASVGKSADTLTKLLDSASESLRRAVANDILGHIFKIKELQDIESRLDSVERIVMERKIYR